MHAHRLCLPRGAKFDKDYQQSLPQKAQGWRSDALPTVWNKRWRPNHAYHAKHAGKRGRS